MPRCDTLLMKGPQQAVTRPCCTLHSTTTRSARRWLLMFCIASFTSSWFRSTPYPVAPLSLAAAKGNIAGQNMSRSYLDLKEEGNPLNSGIAKTPRRSMDNMLLVNQWDRSYRRRLGMPTATVSSGRHIHNTIHITRLLQASGRRRNRDRQHDPWMLPLPGQASSSQHGSAWEQKGRVAAWKGTWPSFLATSHSSHRSLHATISTLRCLDSSSVKHHCEQRMARKLELLVIWPEGYVWNVNPELRTPPKAKEVLFYHLSFKYS